MQMPSLPEELFVEGMKQLVALDRSWIPQKEDHSLYIRPFMFASDEVIGNFGCEMLPSSDVCRLTTSSIIQLILNHASIIAHR